MTTYSSGDGGLGANVYVFDTGINVEHGDFEGRAINCFACLPTCVSVSSCANNDDNGHGTHVAANVGDLQYGVAKHAIIHGMQVITTDGQGSLAGTLNAMSHVVDEGHAIYQMSISSATSALWDYTVDHVLANGVIVVVAATLVRMGAFTTQAAQTPHLTSELTMTTESFLPTATLEVA